MNMKSSKTLVSTFKKHYFLSGFLLICTISYALLTSFFLAGTIEKLTAAVMEFSNAIFLNSVIIFICVGVAAALFNLLKQNLLVALTSYAAQDMETALIDTWKISPYRGVYYSADQMQSQLRGNILPSTQGILAFFTDSVSSVVTIIGSCIYVAAANPILLIFILLLDLALMFFTRNHTAKLSDKMKNWLEDMNRHHSMLWERVRNKEAGMFLNFQKVTRSLKNQGELTLEDEKKFKEPSAFYSFLVFGFGYFLYVFVGIAGGLLYFNGKVTLEALFGTLTLLGTLSSALFNIPKLRADWSSNKGVLALVDEALCSGVEDTGRLACPSIQGVSIKNLNFSYGDTQVLYDINLTLKPGAFVAVVGKTGCGKSTLMNILCKKLPYEDGEIFISDNDFRNIARESYWKHITYIGQQPKLVEGTLLQNIIMSAPLNESRFLKAIHKADLESYVNSQPAGRDTELSSGSISSGELQKVSLARALYRDTEVYLMDEITSALDPAAEEYILETLSHLKDESKIILYISHRKAVLNKVDQVMYMRYGEPAVIDTHSRLYEKYPQYRSLIAEEVIT